jgi:hypothetical protein
MTDKAFNRRHTDVLVYALANVSSARLNFTPDLSHRLV